MSIGKQLVNTFDLFTYFYIFFTKSAMLIILSDRK